jgi:biopolymer transport protein ExbD/biopolymer transport protein TolR
MAMSLNGGNGSGGFGSRRRGSHSSLAEINVTPFVDVVLVLLVIFMLTAHVMEFGIEVDVPKVRGTRESAKDMPVVTITRAGEVHLNEKPVNIHDLVAAIRQQYPKAPGVYVRADRETIWDPIAQVTYELGEAKLPVNLVTQPEDETKGRR